MKCEKMFGDVYGIFGLGRVKEYSIYEQNKEKYYFEKYLLAICSSSSGHVKIYLDYSMCGVEGEPRVIAIDDELMEPGDRPWVLADNFESFIKSLCYDESGDCDEETDGMFVPDCNLHSIVKRKILLDGNARLYIFMLIIFLLTFVGLIFDIMILAFFMFVEIFLFIVLVISSIDILRRKYKCWYDELVNIQEVNGQKKICIEVYS